METTATKNEHRKRETRKNSTTFSSLLSSSVFYDTLFFRNCILFFSCVFVFGYARLDWFCLVVLFSCCIWLILLFNENVIFNVFFFCFLIMWITIIQKYIFVFLLRTPCVKISSSLCINQICLIYSMKNDFELNFLLLIQNSIFPGSFINHLHLEKKWMNEWFVYLFNVIWLFFFEEIWFNSIQTNNLSINQNKQTNCFSLS